MKLKFTVTLFLSVLFSLKISGQYQQYSSSTEIDPECYCHFEFDYFDLIDYYAILAEAQRQAWLNERELEFKEEIESRMGRQFTSFDQAQKEFFKQRFASYGAAPYYQARSNELLVEQKELTLQRDITFPRFKALELRYNDLLENGHYDAEYDFGAVQYYGQRFESHDISYIIASKSNRLDQYNENQFPLSNLYIRGDKLQYVKTNKLLEEYIAGRFVNHYNQHSSIDRVELMSKYMIIDNIFPPYGVPQWGPAAYNMSGFNYEGNLLTLINNANIDPDPIPDPNLNADEIIKRFAITSLDPYESGNSYISELVFSDANLTQKTGNYLDYHSFRAESLGLAKEFFTKMLNNQNFSRPTSFYRRTSVGRQTEDRETRIFNASLTTAASDADFARFTDVIAAFAENPENYKYEGYIMRQMITSNYLNIPSVLSNEDLGRLFDFETGSPYLRIRFSNDVDYGGLFHRDREYGWDLFEDPFKIAALDEMARGGYADFREEIIFSEEFANSKAACVYEKLSNSSTTFKNAIKNFDGEFPVAHLKFEIDQNMSSNTLKAYTTPPLNYVINIVLNGNATKDASYQKRPNLMVAKTIIHEVIHAEMWRKILSIIDNGGNVQGVTRQEWVDKLSNGDYSGIFDYYTRFGVNGFQHPQMAAHYRDVIADGLESFDQNAHLRQFYEDLAWEGLIYKNDPTWSNLSCSERTRIQNTINNYFNQNKNEACNE